MRIKIIQYDGTEMFYDAESFEFRTNQVSNWIKIKFGEGKVIVIDNVCVIKTIEGWFDGGVKYDNL